MQFLKMFGLGILYALLFPFFLIILVLFAVYGIINFFIELVIMLINFFSGKKLFAPYPEDEKAYAILTQLQQAQLSAMNPKPATTNVYVQQNYYHHGNQPLGGTPTPINGTPNQPGQVPHQNPYAQNGQLSSHQNYASPRPVELTNEPADPTAVIESRNEEKK